MLIDQSWWSWCVLVGRGPPLRYIQRFPPAPWAQPLSTHRPLGRSLFDGRCAWRGIWPARDHLAGALCGPRFTWPQPRGGGSTYHDTLPTYISEYIRIETESVSVRRPSPRRLRTAVHLLLMSLITDVYGRDIERVKTAPTPTPNVPTGRFYFTHTNIRWSLFVHLMSADYFYPGRYQLAD